MKPNYYETLSIKQSNKELVKYILDYGSTVSNETFIDELENLVRYGDRKEISFHKIKETESKNIKSMKQLCAYNAPGLRNNNGIVSFSKEPELYGIYRIVRNDKKVRYVFVEGRYGKSCDYCSQDQCWFETTYEHYSLYVLLKYAIDYNSLDNMSIEIYDLDFASSGKLSKSWTKLLKKSKKYLEGKEKKNLEKTNYDTIYDFIILVTENKYDDALRLCICANKNTKDALLNSYHYSTISFSLEQSIWLHENKYFTPDTFYINSIFAKNNDSHIKSLCAYFKIIFQESDIIQYGTVLNQYFKDYIRLNLVVDFTQFTNQDLFMELVTKEQKINELRALKSEPLIEFCKLHGYWKK